MQLACEAPGLRTPLPPALPRLQQQQSSPPGLGCLAGVAPEPRTRLPPRCPAALPSIPIAGVLVVRLLLLLALAVSTGHGETCLPPPEPPSPMVRRRRCRPASRSDAVCLPARLLAASRRPAAALPLWEHPPGSAGAAAAAAGPLAVASGASGPGCCRRAVPPSLHHPVLAAGARTPAPGSHHAHHAAPRGSPAARPRGRRARGRGRRRRRRTPDHHLATGAHASLRSLGPLRSSLRACRRRRAGLQCTHRHV